MAPKEGEELLDEESKINKARQCRFKLMTRMFY
jgi:hypothetical protein